METNEGSRNSGGGVGGRRAGAGKIILLILVIRGCFDRRWLRVGGEGQKVLFAFSFLVLL